MNALLRLITERNVVAPLAGARFASMFDPLLHLSYSSAKEQHLQLFL